jgi:hypothetical protein
MKKAKRKKSKSLSKRAGAKPKASKTTKAKRSAKSVIPRAGAKIKRVAKKAAVAAGMAAVGAALSELAPEQKGSKSEAADPAGGPSGGSAGASTSVGGENLIAYELDRLFRAERRPNTDLDYPRAEAARILLTTASHRGMLPEDRTYLVRLVAAQTGLAQPDAERRVDDVAARAKENIARARKSAVILAFTAGAAALLGAAAAWFAACAGGRVRDGELSPPALWDWRRSGRRTGPTHRSSASR